MIKRQLGGIARLATLASAALFAAMPIGALADEPTYATNGARGESINGTISAVNGKFALTLSDSRGFDDNVSLHDGTVITPTGLSLTGGQVATIIGHAAGRTFVADEIDIDPSSISNGDLPLPAIEYAPATEYGYGYPGYALGYGAPGIYGYGGFGSAPYAYGGYGYGGYGNGYGYGYGSYPAGYYYGGQPYYGNGGYRGGGPQPGHAGHGYSYPPGVHPIAPGRVGGAPAGHATGPRGSGSQARSVK